MERSDGKWEKFRNRLQKMAEKGIKGLPSIDYCPNWIELNTPFHDLLEKIRADSSKDYLEKGACLAWWNPHAPVNLELHSIIDNTNSQAWLVASKIITGEASQIDNQLFQQTIDELTRQGLSTPVVIIHSHPGPHLSSLSFEDLGCILADQYPLEMVTDSRNNYLMMKSYQAHGATRGFRSIDHKEVPARLDNLLPAGNPIIGMARKFCYALYSGQSGQLLTRLHPPLKKG